MPGTTETDPESLVYLDANTLTYLVEGAPDISKPLVPLFEYLRSHPGTGVTSELTLAEVLAPTLTRGVIPPHLKRAYLSLLVWSRFITLLPITREILYDTTKLRAEIRLKLPDAIHLSTAVSANCRFMMTRDKALKTPRGMTRVEPDSDGVRRVLEAFA
jgi:predicted nucleic acid-binding protein